MNAQAAHHLGQLTRELLEHGFERVEIEREVRQLEVGSPDLDGREVDCFAITADGRQIVAIEAALVDDGDAYTRALSAAFREPDPPPSGFVAL